MILNSRKTILFPGFVSASRCSSHCTQNGSSAVRHQRRHEALIPQSHSQDKKAHDLRIRQLAFRDMRNDGGSPSSMALVSCKFPYRPIVESRCQPSITAFRYRACIALVQQEIPLCSGLSISYVYGALYGSLHVCPTPDSCVMAVGIRKLLINLSRRGSLSVGHAGYAAAISFMSVAQTIRPPRPGTAFSASCLHVVHVTNGHRGALRLSKRQSTSSSGEEEGNEMSLEANKTKESVDRYTSYTLHIL